MSEYKRKGETYETLAPAEKTLFAQRCREDDNLDPASCCPLCLKRRLTVDLTSRYNEETLDWEYEAVRVDCHTCQRRYYIVNHPRVKAANWPVSA